MSAVIDRLQKSSILFLVGCKVFGLIQSCVKFSSPLGSRYAMFSVRLGSEFVSFCL